MPASQWQVWITFTEKLQKLFLHGIWIWRYLKIFEVYQECFTNYNANPYVKKSELALTQQMSKYSNLGVYGIMVSSLVWNSATA